ncbi:MAG: aldehyde dehydrogenase [Hyphomicrobiaceae bacterium]
MTETAAMASGDQLLEMQRPLHSGGNKVAPLPAADVAEAQRAFFRRGLTREIDFRVRQLRALRNAIVQREGDILQALKQDLGRPMVESYTSEISIVLHEIDFALKNLAAWAKPRKVRTPLMLFPGSSWVYPEPYGCALVIAPWNYPFQLALSPLVGALAAGNCAVVKPSEAALHTSRLIADMIGNAFDPGYLAAVEGGVDETKALLEQRFDYIFFTGATRVGKIVMAAAARHLTPVTLELGGKNPCIVDTSADLDKAARRIAWGKFVNAGQTCIAPDFVLAEKSIKPALLARLAAAIKSFYGADPMTSPDFGRIVNDHHFERLRALMGDGEIVVGGKMDAAQRYIAPTIVEGVSWDHAIMQEEIFGPILPVLGFDDLEAVLTALEVKPKPLALYFFSEDRDPQEEVLRRLSSGGACVNDTFAQLLNLRLPFGGVGDSGMGVYHGKAGFETFSHSKSVVKRSTWLDPGIKYPPYRTPLAVLRRVMPLIS